MVGHTRDGNPEIYYKRSTDGGATGDPIQGSPMTRRFPRIQLLQFRRQTMSTLSGVTSVPSPATSILEKVNDGGTTWGPDTRLSTGSPNSVSPAVAVWLNNVHVVWDDFRDGNDEIYYRRSADAGTSWGEDTRLTNNPAFSITPTVAAWGNNIQIAWVDYRDGPAELYL